MHVWKTIIILDPVSLDPRDHLWTLDVLCLWFATSATSSCCFLRRYWSSMQCRWHELTTRCNLNLGMKRKGLIMTIHWTKRSISDRSLYSLNVYHFYFYFFSTGKLKISNQMLCPWCNTVDSRDIIKNARRSQVQKKYTREAT